MTAIESLADVRPGDIYFGPIGGAVGVGVALGQVALGEGFRVGPLSIRHVGIVVGNDQGLHPDVYMVQAMPHGAEQILMTPESHWTSKCAYVRLPEDYPGQAEDAAAIAQLMVAEGVAYSFASYAALALWHWGLETPRLEAWIDRRGEPVPFEEDGTHVQNGTDGFVRLPREAICSVLVDQAWTLAGKKIMVGTPKQCVTPGRLAGRLLFETPDAHWAFPGRTSPVL